MHNPLPDARQVSSFAEVRREVRFHYQWIVLNDFLPTLVAEGPRFIDLDPRPYGDEKDD